MISAKMKKTPLHFVHFEIHVKLEGGQTVFRTKRTEHSKADFLDCLAGKNFSLSGFEGIGKHASYKSLDNRPEVTATCDSSASPRENGCEQQDICDGSTLTITCAGDEKNARKISESSASGEDGHRVMSDHGSAPTLCALPAPEGYIPYILD